MEQGGTLTRATVSATGLTEKTKIDTNVSRYIVSKDTVYYLKGSNVQSGTLYKFTYSESVLIENDVRSLEQLSDGNLLYYQKSADGNTALFLLQDGEAVQVGEHVLLGSAKYSPTKEHPESFKTAQAGRTAPVGRPHLQRNASHPLPQMLWRPLR